MSLYDHYLRLALRSRSLTDAEFDSVYPPDVRAISRRFWTPLIVAWRAAAKLADLNATRILDVGSGSGKFCVVAAALAPHATFVGVEQRPHLVAVARDVATRMETSNAHFFAGDATRARFEDFDAIYFFNPFDENTFDETERIDSTVELSLNRCIGGRLPSGYELLSVESIGSDLLCFWRKAYQRSSSRLRKIEGSADPSQSTEP
jgi:SAM-dependent methyltransferase